MEEYKDKLKIFKALNDETRLKIIDLLKDKEKCACVLIEKLNIAQPALSYHMKILLESKIVKARQEGKWMHYSLDPYGINDAIFEFINTLKIK
ncbi:MAG: metalloregulator ArsR/SmtB family transcription factor [Tissierellia bacterium]|nr:metalloregulator ArsR/SmtB family transcription factor [Tissierellia bacterium]